MPRRHLQLAIAFGTVLGLAIILAVFAASQHANAADVVDSGRWNATRDVAVLVCVIAGVGLATTVIRALVVINSCRCPSCIKPIDPRAVVCAACGRPVPPRTNQ